MLPLSVPFPSLSLCPFSSNALGAACAQLYRAGTRFLSRHTGEGSPREDSVEAGPARPLVRLSSSLSFPLFPVPPVAAFQHCIAAHCAFVKERGVWSAATLEHRSARAKSWRFLCPSPCPSLLLLGAFSRSARLARPPPCRTERSALPRLLLARSARAARPETSIGAAHPPSFRIVPLGRPSFCPEPRQPLLP